MTDRRREKRVRKQADAKASRRAPAVLHPAGIRSLPPHTIWIALGLLGLTVAVYAPVAGYDFIDFDDPGYVTANPALAGGVTWRAIAWAFTTGRAANWHPVTWLSHLLDVQLYGLAAGPHHLTSVALHLANTLLLFALLQRLTGALGRSAFVAALFAVHPLHVESVAWIAERKDVLSTFFWLLTLWAYVRYVQTPTRVRYLVMAALLAVGLMAKPMLVTLPFVLLLLDYWPLRRVTIDGGQWPVLLRLVREKLPLFPLVIASSVVTFVIQQRGGAVLELELLPLPLRVENAIVAYVEYLIKMVLPVRLAILYPYSRSISLAWVIGSLLVLMTVSVLVAWAAKRHPYLPVGWLWYVVTLVPVIGLIQVGGQPFADRYTYVPLIGLFIIVGWSVPDLVERYAGQMKPMLATAAIIVVFACAITAAMQVRHWKDSISLWQHTLAVTTDNAFAHHNLAVDLVARDRVDEAIREALEAIRLRPEYATAHYNLGIALVKKGKLDEGIAHYREAIRLQPDFAQAHGNLGVALNQSGKTTEALHEFSETVRFDPGSARAHSNLGAALVSVGRLAEALREFQEAIRLQSSLPGSADVLADLHARVGILLDKTGNPEDAARHLQVALQLNPGNQGARLTLNALTARSRPGTTGAK